MPEQYVTNASSRSTDIDKENNMGDIVCNDPSCGEPAVSLVRTRNLGRLASAGQETAIIWDIGDTPKTGWAKATPVCAEHRTELLASLAKVLG